MTEYEFAVEGMTCVACSSSIERQMKNKFGEKGLKSATVVLLTHKLTTTFAQNASGAPDSAEVCRAVHAIGFGCKLLKISEVLDVKLRPLA